MECGNLKSAATAIIIIIITSLSNINAHAAESVAELNSYQWTANDVDRAAEVGAHSTSKVEAYCIGRLA